MASILRYYINSNELPSVPKMKKKIVQSHQKIENIQVFLKWCGSCKEIITLSALQIFLYTIEPMDIVIQYFQKARQNTITRRHKPNKKSTGLLLQLLQLSKTRQPYEEKYLISELSMAEMFEYSSLANDVEMGIDALSFDTDQNNITYEYESFNQTERICSDMLVVHSEDLTTGK